MPAVMAQAVIVRPRAWRWRNCSVSPNGRSTLLRPSFLRYSCSQESPSGHPLPCKLNDRSMQAVSRLQTDGCGILHEQPADQAGRYFDRDQDFVPGRESRYDMECAIASQRSAIPAASPVLSFTRETDRSVGCPETRRAAMRNLRDAGAKDWKTSGHLFRLTGHGVYKDASRAIPRHRD